MVQIQPRRTQLGHVPSNWLRPRRAAVVIRALVVALYGTAMVLISRELATLDTQLFYRAADVHGLLDGMGEDGRAEYRLIALADLGFIAVYSSLLTTWMKFLRVREGLPRWLVPAFGLLPGVLDLGETVGALVLVGQFPELQPSLTLGVAIATPLKWASLVAIAVVLGRGELVRWRKRHDLR